MNHIKKILILFALFFFLASNSHAGELKVGNRLPEVFLDGSAGELELEGDGIVYQPWHSETVAGKAFTIYHVAARLKIDDINKPYFKALEVEKLPRDKYETLSILNIDDVFYGGRSIARSRFEQSYREHANERFVLDDRSEIQKTWGLSRRGSAIIIIDKAGTILAFKDGRLTSDEIKEFIRLIKQNM